MGTPEKSEAEQREILQENGWVALEGPPLGEGGGARVFRVLKKSVIVELREALQTPSTHGEIADRNATKMARLLSEVVNGFQTVLAAGKVAKRPDHRVKREIEILRDVQHPNLIRMMQCDQSDTPSWYVMPIMRGGVLKDKRNLKGDIPGAVRGMLQVSRALAALHTHDDAIVHRDIKPGNVFIADDGAWILGDPGVAYRDDGGDETTTRPLSKDWAPTWYGEELARTPKADLYMLGKTVLSVIVGGDKPLDPGHVRKPKFDLPELFPDAPGVGELYKVLCSLVVGEPDDMPFNGAHELVPALEALVPIVTNSVAWQLRQELEAFKHEVRAPRLVLSFINSNSNLLSGDHAGLKDLMFVIPGYCTRLVFWAQGHRSHTWAAVLHVDNNKVAELHGIDSPGPSVMQVPTEVRGELARLTITNQSGLLHSLMVYAEA